MSTSHGVNNDVTKKRHRRLQNTSEQRRQVSHVRPSRQRDAWHAAAKRVASKGKPLMRNSKVVQPNQTTHVDTVLASHWGSEAKVRAPAVRYRH
jgi:hypothetical protein